MLFTLRCQNLPVLGVPQTPADSSVLHSTSTSRDPEAAMLFPACQVCPSPIRLKPWLSLLPLRHCVHQTSPLPSAPPAVPRGCMSAAEGVRYSKGCFSRTRFSPGLLMPTCDTSESKEGWRGGEAGSLL